MLRFIRSRLYLQVYLAIVGAILLLVLVVGGLFAAFEDKLHEHEVHFAASLSEALLPAPGALDDVVQARVADLHRRLGADLTVIAPDGRLVASAGKAIVQEDDEDDIERGKWMRFRKGTIEAGVQLSDGRWALMRREREPGRPFAPLLLVFAATIALAAYPLARRITRRLERLRGRVQALGEGDLGARVEVEGCDEIADVASTFNASASRIEQLVTGQRAMLAGASHELRTPLTRMRMAMEFLDLDERPALAAQMTDDIEELDQLIDELLVASRLELDASAMDETVRVDLLAVAAEEGARTGASTDGDSVEVMAEPRWLARAVRNLLENARKYGGPEVRVVVERVGEEAVLRVEDNGDGVAEELRELVFEPFFRPPGLREGHDRGVGLGLALVRRIVRRHGGEVSCEARSGGGSCFVMRLPVATTR